MKTFWVLYFLLSMAEPAAARSWIDCHHNRQHQLVCRPCSNDTGTVRCGQPRIQR